MHKGLIRKTMKNEDVEVELSFMQQMQKIESDKVLSCVIQYKFLDAIASVGLPMSVSNTFFESDGISACNVRT